MRSILFILLFISGNASAQFPFYLDTLTIEDRMGSDLDSVDISNSNYSTTFDGGLCVNCPTGFSGATLFQQILNPVFQPKSQLGSNLYFSGLPHLGFAYSFGGQGAQFIRAKYFHAFSNRTILNVRYSRNIGAGVLRRSTFSDNNIAMDLERKGRRYSFKIHGNYQNINLQHPGGIKTDTLIEEFGLEFTPVFKLSAESSNAFGNLHLSNYFNFRSDSINQLGLMSNHQYSIRNRVYTEYDTLYGIYNIVYIDSFATRDQYNLPSVQNGAGLFLFAANGRFYADVYAAHVYWDYQNLGVHQYHNEYNLNSLIAYYSNKMDLANKAYYNLVGRFNEWKNEFQLNYHFNKGKANAHVIAMEKAIEPWQRMYFANQYDYFYSDSLSNQLCMSAGLNISYQIIDSALTLKMFSDWSRIDRPYLLNTLTSDDFTNQFIESFNIFNIGAEVKFSHKIFHMNIRGVYAYDEYGYMPAYQLYARPYIQTGVFKAKKLQMLFGVDFSLNSAYRLKTYVPNIDYFNWLTPGYQTQGINNLHAFLSLGIDEFRFFIRYENIGYFWNDKTTELLSGYPLPGTRLRVGITWDFFN